MDFNDVKDKVCQLEGAIKRLDSVRKHLSRNASDIKTEIHASVSRNLECLRGREVSLLSAVDQVLGVKEDTLQGQQARLNQALGVLQTSLTMAGGIDTDRQLADTLDRLNKVELSPEETPYISFRADHLGLREAILSYGRVDANGLPLATAFEDPGKPSASLPRHLEEYDDVDHHVFYKTLGQTQAGRSPVTSINVTIPKLSTRTEDWLQKKSTAPSASASPMPATLVPGLSVGAASSAAAARPCTLPQRVRVAGVSTGSGEAPSGTPGSSCSLNNWLSLIKQHADLEEEHDFVITDNTADTLRGKPGASTPPKGNPNSEDLLFHTQKDIKFWLQPGPRGQPGFSDDFFKHIPSDTKVWLAQACSQLRELSTACGREKTPDPFAHISKELSAWLRSRAATKNGSGSYCRGQMNSGSAGLKVAGSSSSHVASESAAQSDFFSHISKSKEDWLHSKSKAQKTCEQGGGEAASKTNFSQDTRDWLMPKQAESPARCKTEAPAFELEEVCRANELCCSMSECVSKPDCVTMYFCNEATPSAAKEKNQKSPVSLSPQAFKFQQLQSALNAQNWLSPSSKAATSVGITTSTTPLKTAEAEEWSEKLSLDMQAAEKKKEKMEQEEQEKTEKEGGSHDSFFHMIPGAADPVWLCSSTPQATEQRAAETSKGVEPPVKGEKEEKNLWLRKAQPPSAEKAQPTAASADALFQEWLMLAKGNAVNEDDLTILPREKEDSEGWSVVSDTYSVESDQEKMDVATADSYISKWLL